MPRSRRKLNHLMVVAATTGSNGRWLIGDTCRHRLFPHGRGWLPVHGVTPEDAAASSAVGFGAADVAAASFATS